MLTSFSHKFHILQHILKNKIDDVEITNNIDN